MQTASRVRAPELVAICTFHRNHIFIDPDIWGLVNNVGRSENERENLPIFQAACRNDEQLVNLFLAKGADLRVMCKKSDNHLELHMYQLASDDGDDDNESSEETVMELAAQKGYLSVTRELVLKCWEYTDVRRSAPYPCPIRRWPILIRDVSTRDVCSREPRSGQAEPWK